MWIFAFPGLNLLQKLTTDCSGNGYEEILAVIVGSIIGVFP